MDIIIIDDDRNFLKTMEMELQGNRGIEKIWLAGSEKETFDLLGKDDIKIPSSISGMFRNSQN